MQTVAELPEYIRAADKLLSAEEWQDIIRYLAEHPKDGALMEGTGGAQAALAARFARQERGRSRHLLLSR